MEEQWVLQRRDSRYFGILLRQRRVNGPESIGLAHRRAKRVWWKLKPLDGIGRAVKYCLLHPPTRLPLPTLFLSSTLFEHLRFGEDSPFQTKPEVKRRRVYFTSPSPYLPLLSLFTSYLSFPLDRFNPLFDSMPFPPPCIGERAFLLSDNSTFLSRKISILRKSNSLDGKLIV